MIVQFAKRERIHYLPIFITKLTDGRVIITERKVPGGYRLPRKMARLKQWCEDINTV